LPATGGIQDSRIAVALRSTIASIGDDCDDEIYTESQKPSARPNEFDQE
jgi:hypothetical protein